MRLFEQLFAASAALPSNRVLSNSAFCNAGLRLPMRHWGTSGTRATPTLDPTRGPSLAADEEAAIDVAPLQLHAPQVGARNTFRPPRRKIALHLSGGRYKGGGNTATPVRHRSCSCLCRALVPNAELRRPPPFHRLRLPRPTSASFHGPPPTATAPARLCLSPPPPPPVTAGLRPPVLPPTSCGLRPPSTSSNAASALLCHRAPPASGNLSSPTASTSLCPPAPTSAHLRPPPPQTGAHLHCGRYAFPPTCPPPV